MCCRSTMLCRGLTGSKTCFLSFLSLPLSYMFISSLWVLLVIKIVLFHFISLHHSCLLPQHLFVYYLSPLEPSHGIIDRLLLLLFAIYSTSTPRQAFSQSQEGFPQNQEGRPWLDDWLGIKQEKACIIISIFFVFALMLYFCLALWLYLFMCT